MTQYTERLDSHHWISVEKKVVFLRNTAESKTDVLITSWTRIDGMRGKEIYTREFGNIFRVL